MVPLDTMSQSNEDIEHTTTPVGFLSIFFWLGLTAMIGRVILCIVPFVTIRSNNNSIIDNDMTAKNSNLEKTRCDQHRSDENLTSSMARNDSQSTATSGRELHSGLVASIYAWFLRYFDGEAKRKKQWEHERRKCRDFQQMLCRLRANRAQREAKRNITNLGVSAGGNEAKSNKRKVRIVLPEEEESERGEPTKVFPWKCDEPGSQSSSFDWVTKHSWTIAQIIGYTSISDYKEQKRKQRWDKEVKRYRPLQQQLLSLQVVRAQRVSLECTSEFVPSPCDIDAAGAKKFPWRGG